MVRRTLGLLVLVTLLCIVATSTQAQAVCTGMCWQTGNTPYCGFTAYQEGGRCTILYDPWGYPICALWSCSDGGGGWFPENQGLAPWLIEPDDDDVRTAGTEVRVTLIEPRT